MAVPEALVPSGGLIDRVRDADCAYTWSRLKIMADTPGNPMDAEAKRVGEAWAFRVGNLPLAPYNRVVGLAESQADEVASLAAWFETGQSTGRFEIIPGEPFEARARALSKAGYAHTEFNATLYGPPQAAATADPAIEIARVSTKDDLVAFLDVYCDAWTIPPEVRPGFRSNAQTWLHAPNWTLYLARLNGRPAGEAILYLSDGVGYLADGAVHPDCRGSGVHRALIERRRDDARTAGCDLVCVQAAYLSTSHRNMVRAGMSLLYAQAQWTPLS